MRTAQVVYAHFFGVPGEELSRQVSGVGERLVRQLTDLRDNLLAVY